MGWNLRQMMVVLYVRVRQATAGAVGATRETVRYVRVQPMMVHCGGSRRRLPDAHGQVTSSSLIRCALLVDRLTRSVWSSCFRPSQQVSWWRAPRVIPCAPWAGNSPKDASNVLVPVCQRKKDPAISATPALIRSAVLCETVCVLCLLLVAFLLLLLASLNCHLCARARPRHGQVVFVAGFLHTQPTTMRHYSDS